MNISVISVGKIKEKYLVSGIGEYAKRLSKYCKLNLIEVSDEKCPENLSPADMDIVKSKEKERILKKIPQNTTIITLEIEGKQLTSEDFSKKIDDFGLRGQSNLTFLIGGSLGLDDELKNMSDFKLSFSKMTFPHQLMKMILL
ncbi:MAG: 23S rRNA (pseudouridine(1915)-N(3))-methyltransferase RlmH, partial [Tissierellales bacterium]|nr:23S rRNA (pseudouridine(1915)-N(3))-methyltransferase RlmH [Tissierellales bacterium]